jgi:diguanylate cyclase (GGDEF)-like protein
MDIASKMLLGYMLLVSLSVAVAIFALFSLQRLNSFNDGIIKVDVPALEAADSMLDAVLAQETYEKRFLILGRADMRSLFWERGKEFDHELSILQSLPGQGLSSLKKLRKLHRQYNDLFVREMRLVKSGNTSEASALSNGAMKEKSERIIGMLRALTVQVKQDQEAKMLRINELGNSAFVTTTVLCVMSIVLGVLASLVVTRHIASSLGKLKIAAARIAEGDFNVDPNIETDDEIGALSRAFRFMGRRLAQLEEMYRDASPLTRLPGGVAIEQALNRRLGSREPIAFCVLDLDNFKSFNDQYGYAHGNEVIKETARIIEEAVKRKGSSDDFVGHVGGDDFVVITAPLFMREVCAEIIRVLDEGIGRFYNEKDRKNGYISGKNRQGEDARFPLMTISIAIVTNEQRSLTNALETSELAAELKDYAKSIPASVFVVDKRRVA